MYQPQENPPSDEQANKFDMVLPMIESAHKEMSELSKKRQDGVLNELKVRYINRLLAEAKEALGDDPSLAFVELLDESELPQNSDAMLVLGQWLAAMKQFKDRHHGTDPSMPGFSQRWFTRESPHPYSDHDDDEVYDDEDDV